MTYDEKYPSEDKLYDNGKHAQRPYDQDAEPEQLQADEDKPEQLQLPGIDWSLYETKKSSS